MFFKHKIYHNYVAVKGHLRKELLRICLYISLFHNNYNSVRICNLYFHVQPYLTPGGGTAYLMFIVSSRASSLWPKVLANFSQSSFRAAALIELSEPSHPALCHALSANASTRGKIIYSSCSLVLTVSLHK